MAKVMMRVGLSLIAIAAGSFGCVRSFVPPTSSASMRRLSSASSDNNLLDLLSPIPECRVDRMSSTDLAYIGDVVYELFIRSRTVWPPKRTADLQQQAVALVRAEYQSDLLTRLKSSFALTEKELQVLSRGRNASSGNKNRRNPAAYQDSTAFEALVGYLYIVDKERCQELFQWIDNNTD